MKLGQKQEEFSVMVMDLLIYAHKLGYSVRGGHWLRCRNCYIGADNSVHKDKLAFDINLSYAPSHDERPRLLTGSAANKAHNKLHDYFDTRGGAKRIKGDLNHYSKSHNGVR
jgi:hypothetical protein